MQRRKVGIAVVLSLWIGGRSLAPQTTSQTGASTKITDTQIVHADDQPGNWLTYGRTYSEQRFSPLKQITLQMITTPQALA
jgi:alcohol dehydrogenase (cytochrome c)